MMLTPITPNTWLTTLNTQLCSYSKTIFFFFQVKNPTNVPFAGKPSVNPPT